VTEFYAVGFFWSLEKFKHDARVRSLNLANAASIAVYEAIRQLGA
jgi:tRNA(Leu) C34 or U34 (ribose-2'-O)-methylase TrmL